MVSVNSKVVASQPLFNNLSVNIGNFLPPIAAPACLSNAEQAPLVNRMPQHEPWPRTLLVDTVGINSETDEYLRNTRLNPQFNDDGSFAGTEPIGRIDGQTKYTRGPLWRR